MFLSSSEDIRHDTVLQKAASMFAFIPIAVVLTLCLSVECVHSCLPSLHCSIVEPFLSMLVLDDDIRDHISNL